MARVWSGFLIWIVAVLLVLAPPQRAAAQDDIADAAICAPSGIFTDVRPDPKGPATKVDMGLRVIDVREINDVDQTITVDFAVRMRWQDDRLLGLSGCRLRVDQVWFPGLVLMNSGRVFNRWPEVVSIEEGGRVIYLQRKSGTFSSHHQLQDFPFDLQSIDVTLFPLNWSEAKVLFTLDEEFEGIYTDLNISDWRVRDVSSRIDSLDLDALTTPRSSYTFTIDAQRYVSYYFWKIILPVSLIVVMSWSVFWIDSRQFGTQLGLSATSVLTMIAFIFATTNMLPRLGYFTRLDTFIAGATVMVFLALLQSLTAGYLATSGRETYSNRMDIASRFIFPAVFIGFCVWSFSALAHLR